MGTTLAPLNMTFEMTCGDRSSEKMQLLLKYCFRTVKQSDDREKIFFSLKFDRDK
jgi:hypothetical protein